ncbi:helix-turn-helix domain-containing protein [Mariniflexile sp. HMF6888]|uniref:helix-turn-helix domain-containing protein n=1 Tax=Mariniflexile sp. HMF6888 TaxID=3373086 RepID=UPI00379F2E85
MTHVIQLQNISKAELFEHLENIIDKKLAILTSVDENEKLSIKDVSDELGIAELTVHNYIKKGILPAVKIGRRVFIKRIDLNEALKEVKSLKYKR